MIKQCNVILSNSACTVVDFDGKKVQLPYTTNKSVIYVKLLNGQYEVVSDTEYAATSKSTKNKSNKTNIIKTEESNGIDSSTNE